jgi:hypothetical protein
MNLILNLAPELENRLRAKAAQDGVRPEICAMSLLQAQLAEQPLSEMSDSELLLEAARGLPEITWRRYRELVELRHQESLTPDAHRELVELNELVETTHARRMNYVSELAIRRGKPLRELMNALGFPNYGRV